MAQAAYLGKIAVTTTSADPVTGDVLDNVRSSGFEPSRDELDTSALGTVEKSHILGQKQTGIPLEVFHDASSTPQGRLDAAYEAGTTIYVHVMTNGSTGYRHPVKVSGYSESLSPGEVVTRTYTIKSVGARVATTLS
jgi:hypothetical protein